jgi:RHS repeat-associated protein
MSPCTRRGTTRHGLVGDPVDVVTGAVLDEQFEFNLPGPLPFVWRRYYHSGRHNRYFALGWGHSHEYDRLLVRDLDGLRYQGPVGREAHFGNLAADGDTQSVAGVVIARLREDIYRVGVVGEPAAEFQFASGQQVAPLAAIVQGDHRIAFRHDPQGRLAAITDSAGRLIQVETTAGGAISRLTRVGGGDTRDRVLLAYSYDPSGNLVDAVDAYGNRFGFAYDAANRMIRKTDRRNYSFHFVYDDAGRCVHTQGDDGLYEATLEYRPQEACTLVTLGDGGGWRYQYDDTGRLLAIVDPYGAMRTFRYDDAGRLDAEIDAAGEETTYVYAGTGALRHRVSPTGWPLDPNGVGRPTHTRPAPRRAVEFEYGEVLTRHGLDLPTADEVRSLPIAEEVRRRLVTRTAPAWIVPVRDELGLLIEERIATGGSRHWTYDVNRFVHRYHDADGATYTFQRASWNLRARETYPVGNTTTYEYTATEKLSSATDPGGTRSEYEYDLAGRLVRVRRHGAIHDQYIRDAAGRMAEKRDGAGRCLVSYRHGPGGLVNERELASGELHRFEYDERGRWALLEASTGTTEFGYDEGGRRVLDRREGLGVEHRFEGGRLVETVVLGRFRVEYRHEQDGVVITDPGGDTHRLRLLAPGLVERANANGSSELCQYDPVGRCVLRATQLVKSRKRWVRAYGYSPEGDLLEVSDSEAGVTRYTYDAAHRIASTTTPDGRSTSYRYDQADNLLAGAGLAGVLVDSGNRIAAANGDTFRFDERNRLGVRAGPRGETHYVYDERDMLVRCETPKGVWTAQYDPLDRRTGTRWEDQTGVVRSTEYVWDGDRVAAEIDEGERVRIYVYADAYALVPLWVLDYDGLEAPVDQGVRYNVYTDQIGVPLLLEGPRGGIAWRATVAPYGAAQVGADRQTELALRWPGHQYDAETGLHYNRYRYYSPELARFLQSDPIGIVGGLNLYAYSARPLTHVDVRGLGCNDSETDTQTAAKPDEELADPRNLPVSDRDIASGQNRPFDDLPPLKGRTPSEVRNILREAGFSQTQRERTETIPGPDGPIVRTDSRGGSEIWMRRNADGSYECLRMDPHGHNPPRDRNTGQPVQDFAGEPPHAHLEHIPDDQERRDNATYPVRDDGSGGGNVFDPGASNEDAADSYNRQFTPGVNDTYNDDHDQTRGNDFKANHIPLASEGS